MDPYQGGRGTYPPRGGRGGGHGGYPQDPYAAHAAHAAYGAAYGWAFSNFLLVVQVPIELVFPIFSNVF
ncbi:unnamed protein product [Caenorhabditis nigoni]